jgi:predicted PurR-regulated permease PerM
MYVVIQQIEGNVIYPLVVKKMVGVPPTVAIISLVVGGTLAGFLGALISIPVATVIMELISDIEERKLAKISESGMN